MPHSALPWKHPMQVLWHLPTPGGNQQLNGNSAWMVPVFVPLPLTPHLAGVAGEAVNCLERLLPQADMSSPVSFGGRIWMMLSWGSPGS